MTIRLDLTLNFLILGQPPRRQKQRSTGLPCRGAARGAAVRGRPAPRRPVGGTADRARLCARLQLPAPGAAASACAIRAPTPPPPAPDPKRRAPRARPSVCWRSTSTWARKASRNRVFRGGCGALGTGLCGASGDLDASGSRRAEEGNPTRGGEPGQRARDSARMSVCCLFTPPHACGHLLSFYAAEATPQAAASPNSDFEPKRGPECLVWATASRRGALGLTKNPCERSALSLGRGPHLRPAKVRSRFLKLLPGELGGLNPLTLTLPGVTWDPGI